MIIRDSRLVVVRSSEAKEEALSLCSWADGHEMKIERKRARESGRPYMRTSLAHKQTIIPFYDQPLEHEFALFDQT